MCEVEKTYMIKLSKEQRDRVVFYSSQIIQGGHWGDGDVVLPEENILIEKLKGENDEIQINQQEMKVLFNWIYTTLNKETITTGEDTIILKIIINSILKKIEITTKSINNPIHDLSMDCEKLITLIGFIEENADFRVLLEKFNASLKTIIAEQSNLFKSDHY